MNRVKDKFSKQAATYKKYRPTYPRELLDDILRLTPGRETLWDCGTGNGQVALELAAYFKKVHATDISESQILNATQKENIFYRVERAENSRFQDNYFDLITVAQAIHWFDFEAFNKEINRVSKNGGIVAIWGYGLLHIEEPIDQHINHFYKEIVGPYWDAERMYIDNGYQNIPIQFEELQWNKQYHIETKWTLTQLEGYLNSWSSVQNYIEKNKENPVIQIIEKMNKSWAKETEKVVKFPIFTRIGRIKK